MPRSLGFDTVLHLVPNLLNRRSLHLKLIRMRKMNFGFVNQCQVSESPEIQANAKTFTDANRAVSNFNAQRF